MNTDEPQSTVTHQDHTSLLDSVHYSTSDGEKSLRQTGGTLGISSVADSHTVTTYDTTNDTHHAVLNSKGNEVTFATEEDARDFLKSHNDNLKSQMVVNTSPRASIGDEERAYLSAKRRKEERRTGSHIKGSGVYSGVD